MRPEVLIRHPGQEYWQLPIPSRIRLSPETIDKAGADLFNDFMGPRVSREAFMMKWDKEVLEKAILLLAGKEEHKRIFTALFHANETILDGIVRKDGTPHIHHVLRTTLRTMYRLLDQHGTLNNESMERAYVTLLHDTREDGRQEKKMTDREIREKVFTYLTPALGGDTEKSEEIYNKAALFDQYEDDNSGNKKPHYEPDLKKEGWSSEKVSDDTLDNLLCDSAKASTFLRDPETDLDLIIKWYIQLAGSERYYRLIGKPHPEGKKTNGSIKKTIGRQEFFTDESTPGDVLTDYDHNLVNIYLNTAERFVEELGKRIKPQIPAQRSGVIFECK